MAHIRTGAVVALKQLELAKSRFSGVAPALRERLALAMLVDTCRAIAPVVDQLLVVSAEPGLRHHLAAAGLAAPDVVADPGGGLNTAYAHGAALLRTAGCDRVLASVADLPALTSPGVEALLALSTRDGRLFLRDHTGRGTTMLLARGVDLDPRFEHGSAARHLDSGAAEAALEVPEARLDVDEADDLLPAARLGLGLATAALWRAAGGLTRHDTAVVAADTDDGWIVVASTGHRVVVPPEALGAELASLRPTQRVHLALDGDRVRAAWI